MNQPTPPAPTAVCRRSQEQGRAADHLPIVIRPRPPELHRLEHRLQQDRPLARWLADNPLHLYSMARMTLQRDFAAKARFADVEALVAHLQSLL